jgi:hypothetical protein
MAVETDLERKAVSITWDADALQGQHVDIRCENTATGDVSTIDGADNDGQHVVTFPNDYSGESQVTVTDESGNVEEGTITV